MHSSIKQVRSILYKNPTTSINRLYFTTTSKSNFPDKSHPNIPINNNIINKVARINLIENTNNTNHCSFNKFISSLIDAERNQISQHKHRNIINNDKTILNKSNTAQSTTSEYVEPISSTLHQSKRQQNDKQQQNQIDNVTNNDNNNNNTTQHQESLTSTIRNNRIKLLAYIFIGSSLTTLYSIINDEKKHNSTLQSLQEKTDSLTTSNNSNHMMGDAINDRTVVQHNIDTIEIIDKYISDNRNKLSKSLYNTLQQIKDDLALEYTAIDSKYNNNSSNVQTNNNMLLTPEQAQQYQKQYNKSGIRMIV